MLGTLQVSRIVAARSPLGPHLLRQPALAFGIRQAVVVLGEKLQLGFGDERWKVRATRR